ncbi:MAG: epoxyqueuosine reductase QueH [Sulfurimonas sp.]|uniref:epoxyqueuosine reductase QueH n=1 Tax=Sulfurimonas sp. TaxID=2022749 RepID=UPI00261A72B9|nr:epoxyqueuosine reductase QueH [Sulfurimonas sp.]MDD2652851.1 epoxyqueuosine reductase QueH [Sulfurimonas sp.]MDD3450896.1 epoxyqueuosine reductase QueH [Sulfurimonas sp.]
MLVHICCSVDSHFFLEKLQRDYPQEKLIGFFYDPNIHPYSEYRLRLLDVERSCKKLGIELLEGAYDFEAWMQAVRGLENEPEKGKRCEVCFDKRFEVTAQKALELGEKSFTTSLLVSPLKSQEQLKKSGELFFQKHGIEFISFDYRTNGGTSEQSRVSKEEQLYRQDYCGCIYGLTIQRESQERLMDEMFSPISNQTLPASIEERLEMYEQRCALEEQNKPYKIIKEKFLNYRQFNFKITVNKEEVIPAYALFYSTLPRKKAEGKIEFSHNNIHYFNREEIKFVTLEFFNTACNTHYKSVKELLFSVLSIEKELFFRNILTNTPYDLSPVIIVDTIPSSKLFIELDAKVYEDVQEKIILL